MNTDRIKQLLHAWRPGEDLPAEAAHAREAAAADPELARWLDQERAFDQVMADRLRQVQPPEDLAERILAAAQADKVVEFSKPVHRGSRFPWKQYMMGAAASLLLAAGLFTFLTRNAPRQGPDLAGFVDKAVLQSLSQPLEAADDLTDVRKELRVSEAPIPDRMPPFLSEMQPSRCGSIRVEGARVSVISFSGEPGYRLMVVRRNGLDSESCRRLTRPILYDLGDRLAVAWADQKQVFILVSDRQGESMMRTIHGI